VRSRRRRLAHLCLSPPRRTIAFTAIGGTITASIFFPALESLQQDLNATDDLVAASVSIFIAGQGGHLRGLRAQVLLHRRNGCVPFSLALLRVDYR